VVDLVELFQVDLLINKQEQVVQELQDKVILVELVGLIIYQEYFYLEEVEEVQVQLDQIQLDLQEVMYLQQEE
jgi:uncharacterized protein YbcI